MGYWGNIPFLKVEKAESVPRLAPTPALSLRNIKFVLIALR